MFASLKTSSRRRIAGKNTRRRALTTEPKQPYQHTASQEGWQNGCRQPQFAPLCESRGFSADFSGFRQSTTVALPITIVAILTTVAVAAIFRASDLNAGDGHLRLMYTEDRGMKMPAIQGWKRIGVATLGMLSLVTATGCQVDVAGQTLPSPYWLYDDVQYFAPGTEFKLSREAAAMQAAAGTDNAAPAPAPGPIGPAGGAAPAPAPMPPPAVPILP
jgi:hypothetical protein